MCSAEIDGSEDAVKGLEVSATTASISADRFLVSKARPFFRFGEGRAFFNVASPNPKLPLPKTPFKSGTIDTTGVMGSSITIAPALEGVVGCIPAILLTDTKTDPSVILRTTRIGRITVEPNDCNGRGGSSRKVLS